MNALTTKVLMFGWEFSPLIAGGLGVVCKDLSAELSEKNTQITYVLPRIPADTNFKLNDIEFKSADVDTLNPALAYLDGMRVVGLDSMLVSPYYSFSDFASAAGNGKDKKMYGVNLLKEVEIYAHKAEELASELEFDIIHNHDWMTASAAIKAKEVSDKPMVMHVHSTEVERTVGNPNPYIFQKEKQGMQAADKIIAVSQLTKDRIVANYGIDPEKISVIHNAIEKIEAKFGEIAKSIHKDDKVVLFLARLTAMKGANYLLEAAKEVIQVMPKTKFLFVGDGELLETLVEMSVELGIAHKVTFTGFLPHDQVDRVYRYADVFVMPSVAEPFGITPLEAIKNGTPIILSKQSGVTEVLQNVLKVDFWDTKELANKLIAVLKHGVLAEELTNNSRRDLENLSWDEQSKKVLAVYDQLKQKYDFSSI